MYKKRPDLLELALTVAGVGGWCLDLATDALTWTATSFRIQDRPPCESLSLDDALAYYAPAQAGLLRRAMAVSAESGAVFDVEAPLVTAAGRTIWVRWRGMAVRQVGCQAGCEDALAGSPVTHLAGSLQDVTARRKIVDDAERLAVVARQMTSPVVMTDVAGRTEWINDAFTRLTGYSLADVQGRKPGDLLQGPGTDPATVRLMAEGLGRGDGFDVEVLNYSRTGDPYWVAITCTPLRAETGAVTGFIAIEIDVTARREAEARIASEAAERKRAESLLRDILDSLPMAVTAYDQDERLILANRCFAETLPILARYAVPGRQLENVLLLGTLAGQFVQAGDTPESRAAWSAENLRIHRLANGIRTLHLASGRFVQARERRSALGHLICVRTDMTELKQAEAALRVQAEQDALTGLANRTRLIQALDAALKPEADNAQRGGALVLLDIDYFKQVNDTVGHDVGDALLVEVAARLRTHTRGNDMPARLGGDEFAIVLPGLTDETIAAARVTQLHAALSAPAMLCGHETHIGISAGLTLFPADGRSADRLMKNADLALYDAKRAGRGRWCRYRPEQAAMLEHHVHLTDALRRALAEERIQVALQPKRALNGTHDGFEALARWHDGTRWVPPGEFIAAAEDGGLLVPLGRLLLDSALGKMAALRDMGLAHGRVAVNVGGAQLLDARFLPEVEAALNAFGLSPGDLEFELTETVLMNRAAERIEQTLRDFRAMGVTLALDDFGTGFASLAHVSRLPIQRLKIDRSFVGGIGQAGRGSIITRAVIGLAHGMDMGCVAVGVENHVQMDFLASEGCDSVQGYLIAPPILHLADIADYLRGIRDGEGQRSGPEEESVMRSFAVMSTGRVHSP